MWMRSTAVELQLSTWACRRVRSCPGRAKVAASVLCGRELAAQRKQERLDVDHARVLAHESHAPYLARERAESAAYLHAVAIEQCAAQHRLPVLLHRFGQPQRREHGQPIGCID